MPDHMTDAEYGKRMDTLTEVLAAFHQAQDKRYAARTEEEERFWFERLREHRDRLRLLSVGR